MQYTKVALNVVEKQDYIGNRIFGKSSLRRDRLRVLFQPCVLE